MNRFIALRRAAGILLLLSVSLGALTMRDMTDTRRWTGRIDRAITDYALAERSLQLDLLDERSGRIRNYDPVNADLSLTQANLVALQRVSLSQTPHQMLRTIVEKDDQQEDRVRKFNSDNALIQNSLYYFTHQASIDSAPLLPLNRILKLTLDTSPETVREAREALYHVPAQADGSSAARSYAYAQLLVEILPEIDDLLSSIRAERLEENIDTLRRAIRGDEAVISRRIIRLQLAFAFTIVLLIGVSAFMLHIQRMHTRELEDRANNERLSAAIAILLIDTGPEPLYARIQIAADHLALHLRTRRLQLTLPGSADSLQFSQGDRLAPDWLAKLARAADTDNAWIDGRVIAAIKEDTVGHALSLAMRDAGIDSLVLLRTIGPFQVTIGFVPKDFSAAQRSDHLTGLSSALTAITHGARREIMQVERERLEQRLNEKRRMANLGAIASGVAHNFNNIIGAISGFTEIGQHRTRPKSVEYESFEEIRGAVERARELIGNILSYAKQRRSSMTPIDLNDLLPQTVRMLSVSARNEDTFQLDIPKENLIVYGDPSDLQQVILNICNNASQASGGRDVRIDLEKVLLAERRKMSHGVLYNGDYIVISVSDSGPGVPDRFYPHVFEPFFTTKPSGTGLGLSTAWKIVQNHRGTINVGRASGGGSVFSIWLPQMPGTNRESISGAGARILLISESDRLLIEEEMLAALGYEPVGLSIDTEMNKIIARIPSVDAVLIAVSQAWRANQITAELEAVLGDLPVLATVGATNDGHSVSVRPVSYPVHPEQIATLLSETLSKQQ